MTRRARIHEDDLARTVRAIRGTGLEIHSVTIDVDGGVTVAVHPQNVEAERDEARRALVALRRRVAEERAERAAREVKVVISTLKSVKTIGSKNGA